MTGHFYAICLFRFYVKNSYNYLYYHLQSYIDVISAAVWRQNKGRTIPSYTLLPLLQALSHVVAPEGGTFNSRRALNLVTPLARSRLRVSHLDFSNVPRRAQYPASLCPNLPSTASISPPLTDHSGGGDGAPSSKDERSPNPPAFP